MSLDDVTTEADARLYLARLMQANKALACVCQLRLANEMADHVMSITVTDAAINAVAEVMWNDRDARMGGPWSDRNPNEICVIQTKATAKAALEAALRAL